MDLARTNNPVISATAVVLAATLWGTTGTIQNLLPLGRDPMAVAFLRLALGAFGLLLFSGISSFVGAGRNTRETVRELPPSLWGYAGLSIALYNLFFFSGVAIAGVGVGTAIALGSGPLWVSVYNWIRYRKIPSNGLLTGMVICIVGVMLLVSSGKSEQIPYSGYALSAMAGLAYASFSILTNRIRQTVPTGITTAIIFSIGFLCLIPVGIFADFSWLSYAAILPLLFLGLLATGVAFLLFTFGVAGLEPSTAITLALAELLTAWFLATFVLHEQMSSLNNAGAVSLLVGLVVIGRAISKNSLEKGRIVAGP